MVCSLSLSLSLSRGVTSNRSGFTLFEMMIVIALLGLFFVAVSYMNRDVRIDQTRAERLANIVYDQIRSARNNMIIGKGVASGGTSSLIIADERSVMVSATGITTSYAYGSSYTGVESRLSVPFFDNDPKYAISDISVSSGSITTGVSASLDMTGITMATIVYRANGDIVIAASKAGVVVSTPIRTLRIQTGYGSFSRYVTIDRVTGITEMLVLAQTGSTSGNNMTSGLSCTLGGTTIAHGSSITAYLTSSVPYNSTCSSEPRACTNGVLSGNYSNLGCSVTPALSCTLPWGGSISHGASTPAYSSSTVTSPTTCASVSESRVCSNGSLGGSYTNQGCSVISSCTTAGSAYPACTAVGQVYTTSSTYSGCDTRDKAVCTCIGRATIWSMCNVGTSTAGTGPASYGSMFQWGRNKAFPSSGTVPTLAGPIALSGLAAADSANQFITSSSDWLTPQDDNRWGGGGTETTGTYQTVSPANQALMQGPCQSGYHVPTYQEASDTISIGLSNNITQFNMALMPPLSGYRVNSDGSLYPLGSDGYWWLSSPFLFGHSVFWYSSDVHSSYYTIQTRGFSVRCMQN